MAQNKPLLFMMPFYSFFAEEFIEKINEIEDDEDITVWMNSPGGSVFAGWSVISALEKKTGNKKIEVMGNASSMALYATLFFNEVVAFDVSTFMLHRAYGYVDTDDEKEFLKNVNVKLREKLEARIDQDKFKKITGKTLDDVFDSQEIIDVYLTADQAKKIGLVSKVERLETKEMNALAEKFVAFHDPETHGRVSKPRGSGEGQTKEQQTNSNNNNQKTNKKMTKEEFKVQYPDLYKEIHGEGVTAERDRVEALITFVEVDAETVKTKISSGEAPNMKFFAEMSKKATAANLKADATDDAEGEIEPVDKDEGKTKEQQDYEAAKQSALKAAGMVEPEQKKEDK